MGVGLRLIGRHEGGADLLSRVDDWIRQECREAWMAAANVTDADGRPALQVLLHPTAESVEIVSWDPKTLVVSAKTSSVGPGYHLYLCDVVKRIGEALSVAWDPPDAERQTGDDTGFFHAGDKDTVPRAMLDWLQSSAKRALEILDRGYDGLGLSMPVDSLFQHEGAISTVMGPRPRSWVERVTTDPLHGIDIFPWWKEGLGATYLLGRALCQMWTDVRWRPPITPEEKTLVKNVIRLLGQAYRLDPDLPYPAAEWKELLGYLGIEDPTADEAATKQPADAPRVGYRRREVRAQLGEGWAITVPGSFASHFEDNGSWWGGEAGRAVTIAIHPALGEDGQPVAAESLLDGIRSLDGDEVEHKTERVVGLAKVSIVVDEGGALTGATATAGSVAMTTITFADEADREWAVATWKSVDRTEQA